jgi:hypothetical protein
VVYRVIRGRKQPDVGRAFYGDIIGLPWNETLGESGDGKILLGWADGSQSWVLPIELRLAAER